MEELRVNVALAQTRETDLQKRSVCSSAAAESKWKFEREAAQRDFEKVARIQHELRSELVMASEAYQPPTVEWRTELTSTRQELEATKRELLVARRLINSLRKGESHHETGLKEDNMGAAGRGFPDFTPSPAGSAISESMSTADFGTAPEGFPPFQGLSPPPPETESARGQSSVTAVHNLGVSLDKEEGEVNDAPALSKKPKDRVRRNESTSMKQEPPSVQQESRETLSMEAQNAGTEYTP